MLDGLLVDELDALEALYADWDNLASACALPQMSPAWVLAWWRHASRAEVRTVVVRDGDRVVGLAPFFVQRGRLGRVDYRIPSITLAVRLSPLALPDREWEVAETVGVVLDRAKPRPDLLALEGAPTASHWPAALRARWPGPLRPVLRRYATHGCPVISLREGTFEEWFAAKSSNFRSQMRRTQRQFEAAGGTERLSTAETLQRDVDCFVRLHASRWEGRGESTLVGFGDRLAPMLESAGRRLLEAERFRLRILEVDDEPVSAQLFIAAGGRVLYLNGGWDERFARFKPSMLGLLYTVAESFARGERCLDLGLGEQPYKLRFADGSDPVTWAMLMVPGPKMPLTRLRTAPTLTRYAVRDALKRGLSAQQVDRLRALRARLGH